MKKTKISSILFACCNAWLLLISVVTLLYSITSLVISKYETNTIFNIVNKDYETCFGIKYVHEDSYLTDITCMKMEIASDIIKKSSKLKNQYIDLIKSEIGNTNANDSITLNITDTEAFTNLKNSISDMQEYNKAIQYKDSPLPLLSDCNSLYSTLNYMVYGSDALLMDIVNFIIDEEILSLAADKDTQEIHVMANMSAILAQNLNKQINSYKYTLLVSIIFLFGTCLNIYRLKSRKNKYRRRKTVQKG